MNSFSSLEMIMQGFNVQKECSLPKKWLIINFGTVNITQCNIRDNHFNVCDLNFEEFFKNAIVIKVTSTFLVKSMMNLHILKPGFVKH